MIAQTWNFCRSFIYDNIRCQLKTTENEAENAGAPINKASMALCGRTKIALKGVSYSLINNDRSNLQILE